MATVTSGDLSNPILNSPYDPPEVHFKVGPQGPTGELIPGRRPSESFVPIPVTRKGRRGEGAGAEVLSFDFHATGERREQNTLINDIRREVELWRATNWNGVTPYTRKLLAHWAALPPVRDEPVLFCQREAAETAIFLAEVAGRHGTADYRRRLEPEIRLHNDRLPGLLLATNLSTPLLPTAGVPTGNSRLSTETACLYRSGQMTAGSRASSAATSAIPAGPSTRTRPAPTSTTSQSTSTNRFPRRSTRMVA
jgi:hypothetical protein